ncbi:MAG: S8 family serine peptidase [Bryobacteraceae bacterium]|jgi:minor extracellular serine protease Vpr
MRPFLLLALMAVPMLAQTRYALILNDPPLETSRHALRNELARRNISVTGSTKILLNAIYVAAPKERLDELKSLPGVKGVVALHWRRLNLNRATQLINAPAAWAALGGMQNAGTGIKIAIIDTGIDQTHPAFQDSALKMPAGYPICSGSDCAFTSNKVIVARSYVRLVGAGSDPQNPAADSRPDDYSPRDRIGHGTAVASCAAGMPTLSPAGLTLTGVAPKAYLGNYKIFGSPEVNETAPDDPIIMALEDALNDHMDIATLSLGSPALTGPLDSGAACGNAPDVPCDPLAMAVENAVKAGMLVVVAAGNDASGQSINAPAFGTVESPGDAPSAIAVGATTNSHFMTEGVEVPGDGIVSNLRQITGVFGDAPIPPGAAAAPLVDVAQISGDAQACSTLPAGSLNGAFALIENGACDFLDKAGNAEDAGAAGVIFYMDDQSPLVPPTNLFFTTKPAIMVSNSDGLALKSFIDSNPGHTVFIDPATFEQNNPVFNTLASLSSLGPSLGANGLKPDLVAVGGSTANFENMYMAAQSYDPLGELYSANGYAAASGTSFATPLAAGAAALVKQAHPQFTAMQIKSALVDTAAQDVSVDEAGNPSSVPSLGGGKLDAGAAVASFITVDPPTISYGLVTATPISQPLQITNTGSSSVNLALVVTAASSAASTRVTIDQTSITLAPGASGTVNVVLSGAIPEPGMYFGAVTIQGGIVPLHVPYLLLASAAYPANLIAVKGGGDGSTGQDIGSIGVELTDQFGLPIAGVPVTFTATGGTLRNADSKTNIYGIASADAVLGNQPGKYDFNVTGLGLSWDFLGMILSRPLITQIVDAATFEAGKPVAPGSYISIFGSALSAGTDSTPSARLPLALDSVLVSFDVPSANISVPGHLIYVSPAQVNLQVPWELEGQTSAQVKVTISSPNGGYAYGNVYNLALAAYAPAFFGQLAPAPRGETISLYANGLGPVTNQPASGDPATTLPLSKTSSPATVTIGGTSAPVSFSGLAPGYAGLYQINATVPTSLSPGTYPITITIGNQTSKPSSIAIQ